MKACVLSQTYDPGFLVGAYRSKLDSHQFPDTDLLGTPVRHAVSQTLVDSVGQLRQKLPLKGDNSELAIREGLGGSD